MGGKHGTRRARTSHGRVAAAVAIAGAMIMSSGFMVMATVGVASADNDKPKNDPPGLVKHKAGDDKGGGDKTSGDNGKSDDKGKSEDKGKSGDKGNGNAKVHKVFVCKYVGTPGVDERLQTGNNPISVDTHALEREGFTASYPSTAQFPFAFEDKHGKSVAIAWDAEQGDGQQNEPSVTINDCPLPQGPREVRPQVSSSDPCGTASDSFSVTADPTKFTFQMSGSVASGSVTITFTAVQGWTILGPNQVTLTFTDIPCPGGQNLVSPSVSFTEPTCENPDRSRVNLGNEDKVSYAVTGAAGPGNSVAVNASPKAGFQFAAGTDTTFSHKFKTIESLNCPTDEPTVGGTQTTRPRPDKEPKPRPNEERPSVVLGTQAGVPSAVAAGLPGSPTSGSGSSSMLVAQLMVGTGLVLLLAGGWLGMGARRVRTGVHQV